MTDLNALTTANATRWANARLTRNFAAAAKSLVEAKGRYQAVEARTNVPWFVVAVIHEREASQRWDTQLGQGDPLDEVSVHVPAGRGPFKSWEDGAVDALTNCAPHAARWSDWSVGGSLCLLEQYNGLGYASRGLPSPYIWSGTDQYRSGKYISDGVFDPNAVDTQLGCAGLLMTMMGLDRSICFNGKPPAAAPASASSSSSGRQSGPPQPSIANPSKGSIGAFVASLFAAIFRRK